MDLLHAVPKDAALMIAAECHFVCDVICSSSSKVGWVGSYLCASDRNFADFVHDAGRGVRVIGAPATHLV